MPCGRHLTPLFMCNCGVRPSDVSASAQRQPRRQRGAESLSDAIAGRGGAPCSIANPHDAVGSRRNSRFATALNRLPPTILTPVAGDLLTTGGLETDPERPTDTDGCPTWSCYYRELVDRHYLCWNTTAPRAGAGSEVAALWPQGCAAHGAALQTAQPPGHLPLADPCEFSSTLTSLPVPSWHHRRPQAQAHARSRLP